MEYIATPYLLLISGMWILTAIYVYMDSSKRNKNALLWSFFTLIFGLIALIIYTISVTPADNGSSSDRDYRVREKSSWKGEVNNNGLEHYVDRYDLDDNPIVRVTEGDKAAKFAVSNDQVSLISKLYERKYDDEWLEKAEDHIEANLDNINQM